eukprot:941893-Rhodomonas_salina.2
MWAGSTVQRGSESPGSGGREYRRPGTAHHQQYKEPHLSEYTGGGPQHTSVSFPSSSTGKELWRPP